MQDPRNTLEKFGRMLAENKGKGSYEYISMNTASRNSPLFFQAVETLNDCNKHFRE